MKKIHRQLSMRNGLLFSRKGTCRLNHPCKSVSGCRPDSRKAYDPELLFVECAHCGAPVIWDEGRATSLMKSLGVDPLELDQYCLLLTDGCPECRPGHAYGVRILRLSQSDCIFSPHAGNA